MAELHFVEGPLAGQRKVIDQQQVTFGRSKNSDIHLPDDTKSIGRTHFLVEREGDDFYVVDNNSVNGTWLNGRRIERAKLSDGDSVRAGTHLIRFTIHEKTGSEVRSESRSDEQTTTAALHADSGVGTHLFSLRSELESVPSREYETRQLTIGRGLENNVVLHDGYVGRRHATIEWTSGGYVVRDNRSQQGTTVNGVRVVSSEVSDGDVIGTGTYRFTAEVNYPRLKARASVVG